MIDVLPAVPPIYFTHSFASLSSVSRTLLSPCNTKQSTNDLHFVVNYQASKSMPKPKEKASHPLPNDLIAKAPAVPLWKEKQASTILCTPLWPSHISNNQLHDAKNKSEEKWKIKS